MSFSTTSPIVSFDSSRSYVVRDLEDRERTEYRFEDGMGRTEKDRRFIEQFERIFLAASQGNLKECQEIVAEGFHDFNAYSIGRFGTSSGKSLDKVSPFKIAEMRGHTKVTQYFHGKMKPSQKPSDKVTSEFVQNPFTILEQSSECIFFDKPSQFKIVMEIFMTHRASGFPSSLFDYLKLKQCPVLGFVNLGPKVYEEASFKLKTKTAGYDIYGWKPGAIHKEVFRPDYVLILGARKSEGREYIYYTNYRDSNKDALSSTREYRPLLSDPKVYVASSETFFVHLSGFYHAALPLTGKKLETKSDIQ
jgi:hypothetical protein